LLYQKNIYRILTIEKLPYKMWPCSYTLHAAVLIRAEVSLTAYVMLVHLCLSCTGNEILVGGLFGKFKIKDTFSINVTFAMTLKLIGKWIIRRT